VDGERLYLMRSSTVLEVMSISGEIVDMRSVLATSQGIRDVVDGDVRMADDWFVRQFGSLRLYQPVARAGITVGQAERPDQIAGVWQGGPFTAWQGLAFEPHLADLRNGRFAICARTPQGAALTVVPPYPLLVTVPTPPDPTPEPEPEPVSYTLPADVKATRDRYIQARPWPTGAPSPEFEDTFRTWFGHLIEQIVFSHQGQGWGWKRSAGPPSKDSIANNMIAPELIGFDMFFGVGTGAPTLNPDPQGQSIAGQTFIPVVGIDWLGQQPPDPTPDPDPAPVPPVDLAPLWAEIDALKTQVAALLVLDHEPILSRLDALEQRQYVVKGRTDKGLYGSHYHDVDLPVTVKP
jgi:hypothetical protein